MDALGREIQEIYDAFHLKHVQRFNAFGSAGLAVLCPLFTPAIAIVAGVTLAYAVNQYVQDYRSGNAMLANNYEDQIEEAKKTGKFVFPENPDELLPDLPRDPKGRIRTADNLQIRPEKHPMEIDEE